MRLVYLRRDLAHLSYLFKCKQLQWASSRLKYRVVSQDEKQTLRVNLYFFSLKYPKTLNFLLCKNMSLFLFSWDLTIWDVSYFIWAIYVFKYKQIK